LTNFAFVNACGVNVTQKNSTHLDVLLENFINENIDIMGLTETHLKNDESLKVLPHLSSVCSNRSSASGGTAIIFSRILNCADISHNFHNFEHLEFSVVSFVRFSKSFCFAVVYLPQRSNKEITEFRLFVDQLKDFEFDFTIIVSDFNANHTV